MDGATVAARSINRRHPQRDRHDAALALTRLLAKGIYPVSAYLKSLPDEPARLAAVMAGVDSLDTGNKAAFLLSNQEMFQHLSDWSSQPDTLTVTYEDLVGEVGGGSTASQLAAVTEMCLYFGIEVTPAVVEDIVNRLNRRTSSKVIDGPIGQWKEYLNK